MIKRLYVRLLMQRGQRHLAFGSQRRAFRLFQKAAALQPSQPNLYNLALAHLNLLEYDNARQILESIYNPETPEYLTALGLGQAYLLLDRWQEAVNVFQKLSARYPQLKSIAEYAVMAEESERRKRYCLSTDLQFRAMLAREDGDRRQALKLLREAETHAPENALLKHNIGVLMMELKDDKDAILSYFRQAMALAPENIHFKKHFRKAWAKLSR